MTYNKEIIIIATGTKGDIHPLLGIAIELEKQNYQVTFLANDIYQAFVEAHMITFVSIGTKEQYELAYGSNSDWDFSLEFVNNVFKNYHGPMFKPAYYFVKEKFIQNSNLLIISKCTLNGARAAADELFIPSVLVSLSPHMIPSNISPAAPLCWSLPKWYPKWLKTKLYKKIQKKGDQIFETQGAINALNKIRADLSLKPIKNYGQRTHHNEYLHLGLFPEWFAQRPADWPSTLKLVGFPLFDGVTKALPQDLTEFIETYGKPIVFTPGTGVGDVDNFFTEGQKICNALNVPGVFIGGKLNYKLKFSQANCLQVPYADFSLLLPLCSLIVHHGGMGTLAQAIKAGIPQIIRPLAYDQPDNANKISQLGIGEYVFKEQFKIETVLPIVKALLDNQNYKKNIMRYSADVKISRSLHRACNLIVKKIETIS